MVIRPFQVKDFAGVISLWNQVLYRDQINVTRFQLKVLADPNFDPEGLAVAEENGEVVGFCLGILRKEPLERIGLQEKLAWITAMAVKPKLQRQGIGSSLLQQVEEYFTANNREWAYVATYVPNYFFPGVDVDAYASGLNFFTKHQYTTASEVFGMGREILDLTTPETIKEQVAQLEAEGIQLLTLEPRYTYSLLNFLRTEFPGDWAPVIVDKLKLGGKDDEIVIAVKDDEVLGYAQYEGEHFGPFGVSSKLRKKGVGAILFYRVIELMKAKGYHNVWLAWTGGDAKRFYEEKAGLKALRQHAIMKKQFSIIV